MEDLLGLDLWIISCLKRKKYLVNITIDIRYRVLIVILLLV
jgi:hypothetical protein